MSNQTAPSARTRVRRVPNRGRYDLEFIYAVLDEALVCHVGFVSSGQPFVMPTLCVRIASELFIHGASTSRLIEHAASGEPLCITITLVDGVVLARSAFHHSLNYRSVVVLGQARLVSDPLEKEQVSTALVERVAPGRSWLVRAPNQLELKATSVLGVPLTESSAKVRTGGPIDDEEDLAWPVWAGVIPLRLEPQAPEVAEPQCPGATVPRLGRGLNR